MNATVERMLKIGLPLAVLAAVGVAHAADSPGTASAEQAPPSLEQIRQCSRANLPTTTAVHEMILTSVNRAGGERRLEAVLYWRRDESGLGQTTIQIESPADLRGSAYLLLEKAEQDNIFTYLPSLQRTRRLTDSSTEIDLWSTDFSYYDIRHLQHIAAHGQLKWRKFAEFRGHRTYLVELAPDEKDPSPYQRILAWVDAETCLPLKTEFYEAADEPVKRCVLAPDSLTKIDGHWLAKEMRMDDLKEQTHTLLKIEASRLDGSIPERKFSPTSFYR